ncbi:GAF domain-containing protein [Aliamphritea spongicola]|nr:GAF domain-containing protein [Aliamphritea spongicola]
MGSEPLIVPDTLEDSRVKDIGMVTHPPHVRFYAGVPLIDDAGMVLGTLCAVDTRPQTISEEQTRALTALGNQVMQLLRLRKSSKCWKQGNGSCMNPDSGSTAPTANCAA